MVRGLRIHDGFPNQRRVVLPPDIVGQCRRMPIVRDLHLLSIGSFPAAAHHYFQRREGIAAAVLIHCIGGRGWCRVDSRTWPIGEGQAVFLPPGLPHSYGADRRAPWSIHWIHFTGQRTDAYLQALGVGARQPLLNLADSAALVAAFEQIYALLQLGYTESNLLMLSTQVAHYLALFRTHQRASYRKGRLAEEKILQSLAFMRAHLEQPLSLETLAALVHMSVPHYCALFKRQTNTSPILFLIRLKMQRACELLSGTDVPVAAIGRQVGYRDPFYFCRVFKKTIGVPPTDYRRTVHT